MQTIDLSTPSKVKAFARKVQTLYQGFVSGAMAYDIWNQQNDALEIAVYNAQKRLPKGLCVGALCRFPVADGYALYLVSKVGKRISKVEHLPFGDAWSYQGVEPDGSVFTSSLYRN